jgi:hypothetical protein
MRPKEQNQIIKDIETRLRTVMIGSLSRIENKFGYLWNHGDEPQNDNQLVFADMWEDLRLSILNHGNKQIRDSIQDLEDFFYYQNKYTYKYNFLFNNKKDRS